MSEIILIGGGGHCRSVIDVIETENKFTIAGIIDKDELLGKAILSYKVIGNDNDLQRLSHNYKYACLTLGHIKSADLRIKLFELLKKLGFIMPVIISPRAYVSKYASIEEGSVVMHDAMINVNAKIGKNCIINTKAIVEHDCIIGDNCHVSTGAIVNGDVHVKRNSFIGSNAVIKQAIEIKENSFIKAGTVAV